MTKRQTKHSFLYLATLGVYLGIVLAGGAPVTFAQAPSSAGDKDTAGPSQYPQVNFDLSVMVYLQDVESFLAELSRLREKQRVDLANARFAVAQSTQLPCVAANRAGSYTAERLESSLDALKPFLERYSKVFTDGYALPDCLQTPKFPDLTATQSRFEIDAGDKGLTFSIEARKATPERAAELARLLPSTFEKFRENTAQSLRDRLIRSTQIAARNDQVFVTTRLPRADLDELLAVSAK